MKPGRPSRTAEGVAVVRALEMTLYPPERRVLEDPVALHLIGPRMRLLLRTGSFISLLFHFHERRYRGMVYEVLARGRYAQDRVDDLAPLGLGQIVILGAGLDGTAWRDGLPPGLRIFEVDHPDTQRLKRDRILRAGLQTPERIRFVPFDLGGGGLGDALEGAGFQSALPALVTLLGVLPYLPADRVETLFADIGRVFAPGSEVIYTCFGRRALDPLHAPPAAVRVARRVRRYGEPFRFAADPGEMAGLADRAGLDQVETLDGAALTARFFAARGDPRTVGDWIHLSRAVVRPR